VIVRAYSVTNGAWCGGMNDGWARIEARPQSIGVRDWGRVCWELQSCKGVGVYCEENTVD
jgi:hypothetical protein